MDCEEQLSISILFTNDQEIRELNSSYRNKDKPTDVLSFAQSEGEMLIVEDEFKSIGDVVISVDTAKKQASELGVSLEHELLRLLIHGILHLFGYDHEDVSREEEEKMKRLEDELFARYCKDYS